MKMSPHATYPRFLPGFTRAAIALAVLSVVFARSAIARAPESVSGKILRLGWHLIEDPGFSNTVISLRADGTYYRVFEEYSQLLMPFPELGTRTVRAKDEGSYTYLKTGATTATITFNSTGNAGVVVLDLVFETEGSGRLAGSVFLGQFFLSSMSDAPVVNASARGVASASKPLIIGFYVSGRARYVLARGVGPTLADFNVADAAEDTTIAIVPAQPPSGNIAFSFGGWNDDWETDTDVYRTYAPGAEAPVTTLGAFMGAFPLPSGSKDAAVFVSLFPGAYTAIIRTKSETPAEVLGEIYIVP